MERGKKYGEIKGKKEEKGGRVEARSNLSTKHGTLDDEVKRELASETPLLPKLEPIQPALR